MTVYLSFTCLVLAITLVDGRLPAGGFIWDFLNALGFCGLAGLVYLGWDSESPARQPALRVHSNLAIGAAVLAGAHVVGLLLWDATIIEYLKLKAPWYMHAGLVGFFCLVILAITSFPTPRRRLYRRFAVFRSWHLGLSAAALGLVVWHILGAGFYLWAWYHQLALCVVAVGLPLLAHVRRRANRPRAPRGRPASMDHADRLSMLGLVAAIGLAALHAGFRNV